MLDVSVELVLGRAGSIVAEAMAPPPRADSGQHTDDPVESTLMILWNTMKRYCPCLRVFWQLKMCAPHCFTCESVPASCIAPSLGLALADRAGKSPRILPKSPVATRSSVFVNNVVHWIKNLVTRELAPQTWYVGVK